jgi:hypothetical protein
MGTRTGQGGLFHFQETFSMKQANLMTSFERRSVLLFASLSLVAAGQAFAQPTAAKRGAGAQADITSVFKKAYADSDKRLSLPEAKAIPGLSERFDAVDTDQDGAVSLQELMAAMTRPAG